MTIKKNCHFLFFELLSLRQMTQKKVVGKPSKTELNQVAKFEYWQRALPLFKNYIELKNSATSTTNEIFKQIKVLIHKVPASCVL